MREASGGAMAASVSSATNRLTRWRILPVAMDENSDARRVGDCRHSNDRCIWNREADKRDANDRKGQGNDWDEVPALHTLNRRAAGNAPGEVEKSQNRREDRDRNHGDC